VQGNGSFEAVRREALTAARLYFVLDLLPDAERVVEAALAGGADVVQLRDKDAGESAVIAAGKRLGELCHEHGALFLVNDRPDLAAACDADGVHVGQEDMSVADARALVGPDRLVGLSTHSREQLDAAEGVDYVSVGPVWATPTKEGRPPVGLDLVRYAAERAAVPFFAIGGIDASNVAQVVAAGASRVAVVRAIRDAGDSEAAARRLRAALDG
jgi:thiamine-phosphate pyrophosphorylase